MKIKSLICLLVCLIVALASSLFAQVPTQSNELYVGAIANTDVTDNVKVSGQYAKLISGQPDEALSMYMVTNYDMSGIQFKPLNLSSMQYTAVEALEMILWKPMPWLGVLGSGGAGVNGVQNTTTGFAATGATGLKFIRGAFRAKIYGQAIKTTANTVKVEARFYIGVKF